MVLLASVLTVMVYIAGTVALAVYLRPESSREDDGKDERHAYRPIQSVSPKYRFAATTGGTENCTQIATYVDNLHSIIWK